MLNGRIVRKKEEQTHGLPRIGKIKCGRKVPGQKYPESLDFFVGDGKYANVFQEEFGEKPTTIPIVFLSNDLRLSCNERYECRDSSGKLAGYGDGETTYLYNLQADEYEECDDRDKINKTGKWECILTLKFAIPRLSKYQGIWELSTKGENSSIPQIRATIDGIIERHGFFLGIPFDLNVKKVVSQKPGSKSRFPVISLVCNLGAENLANLAQYLEAGNDLNKLGIITNEKLELLNFGEEKPAKELKEASETEEAEVTEEKDF